MEVLKMIIKEMSLTNTEFAKNVCIKKSTFSDRINEKSEFKQSEISSILLFTGKKYEEIFLTNNSANAEKIA